MRLRLLTTLLKWLLFLSVLGGLALGVFLLREMMEREREEESRQGLPAQSKDNVVNLEDDEAERYGLKTEAVQAVRFEQRVTVYGRVIANPEATAEVRSPFAGTLRPAPGTVWPVLGQRVRAGQTLGWVKVRIGPEVRLDLENKLAEARIKQRGAEEEVKLQTSRAESLKAVTSRGILSRAEQDLALLHLLQAKNQLATAKASAELWQSALREVERRNGQQSSPWNQPLLAPAAGEITALAGRPEMAVEPGALVVEIVDFRRPLVRLDIPPEVLAQGGPAPQIKISVPAASAPSLGGLLYSLKLPKRAVSVGAELAGPAPRVDGTSQFVSYWYDVLLERGKAAKTASEETAAANVLWRPGMQVAADMPGAGAKPQAAFSVPLAAVLYHEGRPLVYVRVGPEKYQRREVRLLGRDADRWVVAPRQGDLPVGVAAQEVVVVRAAQVLLSKEFLVGGVDND